MDTIIAYLIEKWPIIAVILVTAIIVWFAAKLFFRFRSVENHVKNAPCDSRKKEIEDLQRDKENINSISASINYIAKWIMKFDESTIDSLAKCSPYKILPHGYELLKLSSAKKCVDNNFDFFKSFINDRKPETEFDVENIALLASNASMSNSFMNPVKDFLYASPATIRIKAIDDKNNEIEKNINVSALLLNQLIGIYVRDKYLELFPEKSDNFFTD